MNRQDEQPIYETPDFRVYPAFETRDEQGRVIVMQQCQELIEGRWEGFCTIVRDAK